MRRRWNLICVFLLLLLLGTAGTAFAAGSVNVEIAGKAVMFSSSTGYPFIDGNQRTQVPLRAAMEAYGCDVDWDQANQTAIVEKSGTTVEVPIGKSYILVNGKTVQNDTTAVIKNSRTYLPIRAVLEAFGAQVEWNADTKTVEVDAPLDLISVTSITSKDTSDGYRITVNSSEAIKNYKSFSLDNPSRFVLDIAEAKLTASGSSVSEGNSVFSSVRYSQFDSETVRIVVDLKKSVSGNISLAADKKSLYIDFKASPGEGTGKDPSDKPDVGNVTNPSNVPKLDASMRDKLIVIDPGHGGSDVGSVGKSNGQTVLYEKDVNLKIGLRLYEILKNAGANVEMTRKSDTTVGLYDRPVIANDLGADLYISCHNNSSTSSVPTGTETHYNSEKAGENSYAVSSKAVAESVQAELVKALGLKDRGVHNSPRYVVLNRTVMPAIIIEGAFMSNASDLAYLQTDKFVEAYATGTAIGIIKAMNAAAK